MISSCRRPRLAPLVLFALGLVLAALATPARAGTYDVHSCDPNFGGGATPSWSGFADGGLAFGGACVGPQPEGLYARTVSDGGHNSLFQGAFTIFDAAPGTTIASIHGDVRVARPNCDWGVGLVASDGDLAGRTIYYLTAGQCGVYSVDWLRRDLDVNASRVRLEARCGASSCARGSGVSAETQMRNIVLTIRDDTPPDLTSPRGSLWTTSGWLSGSQDIAFDAADGSGVARTDVLVDGVSLAAGEQLCDYTLRSPCPNRGLSTTIDTTRIRPDGPHSLTARATDAAGNPATVSRTINVDNTPPAAPTNLAVGGGEGWRATNAFRVDWNDLPADGGAPIVAASYELCPASGPCVDGTRSGDGISALDGLAVPGPGDWTLRVWLRDAAGNEDRGAASQPVHLRFDDVAPDLAFEPVDPSDPTLVSARAVDALSGVAQGRIEIRREGTTSWQALPSTLEGDHVTARLDDEELAQGAYELQAWAVDGAGNERTTADRADGSAAQVRLPVRVVTRIRAGVARAHGPVRWRARVRVALGRPVRLGGRLLTREGNPIGHSPVLVYAQKRVAGAPAVLVASLQTGPAGRFAYRAPAGTSRTIRFRFGGTATIRPSVREVALVVPARTTLDPPQAHLVNGEYVHLRGGLLGRDVPAGGKLLALQVLLRGRWHTFATARTNAAGRWHYEYRFDGTRGEQAYRFRAAVPREAGYPYAPGISRTIVVHVRGL